MIQNPILSGFYPDPSICRVLNEYYLVTSTFAYVPGIPVFRSTDMEHWTQTGHVLERKSQLMLENAWMSEGIYAPCIRYHNGTFYMITTNVSGGGNFYVTAKTAEGPWSEPIYLKDAQGIDPSLYFEGSRCFYIGQRTKKDAKYFGDCEIWLQELDLQEQKLTGEVYVLWDGAMKNAVWPEGPHLYKRNGYYYLLIAEGGTAFHHSICIARSKNLHGPYESCPMNPIFTHRNLGHKAAIQNTGHGDMVETADGRWFMVMLATRPLEGCSILGRETFIAEVVWEDDWPVVCPLEGKLEVCETEHAEAPVLWKEPLDKRCLFFRYPEDNMYQLKEDGRIALKTLPHTLSDKKSPAYVGIRIASTVFSMETTMEFVPYKGQEAGMVCLYDEKNYIRCVLAGAECGEVNYIIKVIEVMNGKERELFSRITDKTTLNIKLVISGLKLHFMSDGEKCGKDIDIRGLCAEKAGGFVGCTAGIYAASAKEAGMDNSALFSQLIQ